MAKPISPRETALKILKAVLHQHQALDHAFSLYLDPKSPQDRAWIKSVCFGFLKHGLPLGYWVESFLDKPNPPPTLALLIAFGAYQLLYHDTPAHAAIFETVQLAKKQRLPFQVVNAVLRQIDRQRLCLPPLPESVRYNHPLWLQQRIQALYPETWPLILEAGNQHPPFFIRVNQRRVSALAYRKILQDAGIAAEFCPGFPDALFLPEALSVENLPYFYEGYCSVQDLAAQKSASLLEVQAGQKVLDACAAPGGKACHLLEVAPIILTCVDHKKSRCQQIEQNLQRLGLQAEVLTANSNTLSFPPHYFDRILLDAPCSGSGVLRRHPDIRFLKQESDIAAFSQQQRQLLEQLWPMLKPGGILLYATCSILREENASVIEAFLKAHPEADLEFEEQLLPTQNGPDGFYYAKIRL